MYSCACGEAARDVAIDRVGEVSPAAVASSGAWRRTSPSHDSFVSSIAANSSPFGRDACRLEGRRTERRQPALPMPPRPSASASLRPGSTVTTSTGRRVAPPRWPRSPPRSRSCRPLPDRRRRRFLRRAAGRDARRWPPAGAAQRPSSSPSAAATSLVAPSPGPLAEEGRHVEDGHRRDDPGAAGGGGATRRAAHRHRQPRRGEHVSHGLGGGPDGARQRLEPVRCREALVDLLLAAHRTARGVPDWRRRRRGRRSLREGRLISSRASLTGISSGGRDDDHPRHARRRRASPASRRSRRAPGRAARGR